MKKQFQDMLFAACILTVSALLTACHSETTDKPSKETIVIGEAGIKITADEESFQTATPTRAFFAEPEEKTVDLGNGLTANVSIEDDEEEATRAPQTLDGGGTYTIYVVDPATQKRMTGNRKSMKGTFSNGNFTRTEGAITLAPGTYQFLCASQDLVPSHLSDGLQQVCGSNSMMGLTDPIAITAAERDIYIHFTMKHYANRLRFRLRTYKQNTPDIKAKLVGNLLNPTYRDLLPDGTIAWSTNAAYTSEPFSFPASGKAYTELGFAPFTITTDYLYFSGLDGNFCELEFTEGSIYGNALTGKKIALNNLFSPGADQNKSYTVTLSLAPTPVYLFSDGTVGMLEDKGSRRPIAVVTAHKKKGKQGTAIALTDAGGGVHVSYNTVGSTTGTTQNNPIYFTKVVDMLKDMDGYKWTHQADGTVDGRIKANEATDYTAFYQAARYVPIGGAATGANIGKWYIPALGEWFAAFKLLWAWDGTIHITDDRRAAINADVYKMRKILTDVQGTDLYHHEYWVSSEFEKPVQLSVGFPSYGVRVDDYQKASYQGYIRPFVHF